ncbi:MAG: methyltransferase domain-containing protein [Pelobium sp.]
MKKYVQYGCGFSAPKEWKNYDASPTLRFERFPIFGKLYTRNSQRFPKNVIYGDIVKGLPEENNSCDGIYCSHILEHLSYNDCLKALHNTYRILKPSGIFRCVLPSLRLSIENYIENYEKNDEPAHEFMRSTMLGIEDREKGIKGISKILLGNSKHLWMWDEKTLITELKKAGFSEMRIAKFGDSKDPHFSLVEEENRFFGALALECTK